MVSTLLKTPLHDWHASHGGRMVDFAGWSMPVQYSSIVAEHNATRTAAGLFDVSHMGRLMIFGRGATEFIDSIVTRRVTDMQPGQVRYALVTNEKGGILDDVLVYRLAKGDGQNYHLMVVNASNRQKIVAWIERWLDAWPDVNCVDLTEQTAMIAVQGPLALELIQSKVDIGLAAMKYYHAAEVSESGSIVSRTGYTGEDGFELIIGAGAAVEIWESILVAGKSDGVAAAGLGARDTLRLEAGMPLYGHELNEQINPLDAGLAFAVNLDDRKFHGCESLRTIKRDGLRKARVGVELVGKRVPREHYSIFASGAGEEPIGEITSGTFSPTLQKPIAMGYVPPQFSQPGMELSIDIRSSREPARVVKMPFYKRA